MEAWPSTERLVAAVMSVLEGKMPAAELKRYRVGHANLPGHPELHCTPGVKFSSGRLGHMWPFVNGVAMANPSKISICLGSDGSQQEGDDYEATILAVAQNLPVKLIIDDNDVTIAGHPSSYLKGYDVAKKLEGQGMKTRIVNGEDVAELYAAMSESMKHSGPHAVVIRRKMCPGIEGVEGQCGGHDAIAVAKAVTYLTAKGHTAAVQWLEGDAKKADKDPQAGDYLGTKGAKVGANRALFGEVVVGILEGMSVEERKAKVMCIDSDLEGSTGLKVIHQKCPEIFVQSGIMERGNFSAAAGFGMEKGKVGIFSTFAAFLEMCVSEITMARLNYANVLCHFSHSGVDDMADNTCHFGINNFFADNGLDEHHPSSLYYPADFHQLEQCVKSIFWDEGIRFVFTTRSKLPAILAEDGTEMFGGSYKWQKGKDDVVRKGTKGYVVSFGDALYRALDAVERLRAEGHDIGLINKSTLNHIDEDTMKLIGESGMCLVVESLGRKTGLGIRFGTWLLERGYSPKYQYIGVTKEGSGGLFQHAYHQGYDSKSIQAKLKTML
jgi:transketolase